MLKQLEVPERRFVGVDGPVHYREWQGPGTRTFVLVHGLGGALVNWTSIAPELSRLGRVVALDLAGFGHSPRAGRGSGLAANRRLLSGFLRETASAPALLIGCSMGGSHAMLQAALEPGTVAGLILSGSTFPWIRGSLPSPIVIGGFALYRVPGIGEWAARQRFSRASPEKLVRFGFRVCAADARTIPETVVNEHVELFRERLQDPDAAPAFLEAARSLLRVGSRPELGRRIMDRIECPVLVLHGRRDRLVPVEFAEAAVADHPSWRLREFPDLGHIPHLEARDRWLAAVREWIGAAPAA